jgi:hypothetical protein
MFSDEKREKEAKLQEAKINLSNIKINNEVLRNLVMEQEAEISVLRSDLEEEKKDDISEEKLKALMESVVTAEKSEFRLFIIESLQDKSSFA